MYREELTPHRSALSRLLFLSSYNFCNKKKKTTSSLSLHSQARNKPVSINYYTLQHFENNVLQITPQIYLPPWLKARCDQFTQRNAIKRNRCIMTLLLWTKKKRKDIFHTSLSDDRQKLEVTTKMSKWNITFVKHLYTNIHERFPIFLRAKV